MDNNTIFGDIACDLNLGVLIAPTKQVLGGYMHKMYCLETSIGKYAVKLLNPSIMKRPDVFANYHKADRLEKILQANRIPIVPALEFNNQKMQCLHNQYYYIFSWIEGKTLPWAEIKENHCKAIGEILANIHKIEQSGEQLDVEEMNIDWDDYINLANGKCPEMSDMLNKHRDLLYLAQNEYNRSIKNMPSVTCICNGDMDCKNVLWVDERPFVIDLECLDYGNPFWDMFRLALSWSGDVLCDINFELLKAFLVSYHHAYGEMKIDWNVLYGSGFEWLTWLEYNIKRALMIECTDEDEQQMGIVQARNTMDRIIYYQSIKEKLLDFLNTALPLDRFPYRL